MYSPRSVVCRRQVVSLTYLLVGLWGAVCQPCLANPTGGSVASGSAAIHSAPGTTTINQTSNAAIINWQTFSINHGETTQFLQPSSQSAALNRVLGGGTSQINGTLSANGQVFLINQNGVIVGPGGVVNAAGGFTASTRDISNSDFLKGNLHFVGHSQAGISNLGQVNSSLGNVVLIGKTVGNKGAIRAQGTVGLVAGDNIFLGQRNSDGSTITVSPSRLAKNASGKTAVSNSGSITGATAELKAANGNIYAMAINNEGSIRATTVSHQGGHIWLTSDSGNIVNSGSLDASATAVGGKGGTVQLKSTGVVTHTGTILAKGGANGVGGSADVSGGKLNITGTVNLTAPGGITGSFLIDPATLTVVNGGTGAVVSGQNNSATTIDPSVVDAALNSANLILNADSAITITNGITWTSSNTLTLSTNFQGATISINAPINGINGGLTLQTAVNSDKIQTSVNGSVGVGNFILARGFWNQNSSSLPDFFVANDFELQGSSTFLRVQGGTGSVSNPYLIGDVYGLQGINSPSLALLGSSSSSSFNWSQTGIINAGGTSTWNSGAGFNPIGTINSAFYGSYNGNNFAITGLKISRPSTNFVGLFGYTIANLSNIQIVGGSITGMNYTAGVTGSSQSGYVINSSYIGSISGGSYVGGLVGSNQNNSFLDHDFTEGSVAGTDHVGGLAGYTVGYTPGIQDSVSNCYSNSTVTGTGTGTYLGGLVGQNDTNGTINLSYATGAVTDSFASNRTGGLIGINYGTVTNCYATGAVSGGSVANGNDDTGGLVGNNYGTISTSYATGAVTALGTTNPSYAGGFVGDNVQGSIANCYATGSVTGGYYEGGFAGGNGPVSNAASINTSYSAGTVSGGTVKGCFLGQSGPSGTLSNNYCYTGAGPSFGIGSTSSDANATRETLAALKIQGTFSGFDFSSNWVTDGTTTPLLQPLSFHLSGTAGSTSDTVYVIENGNVVTSTTGVTNFNLLVPADVFSGTLVTDKGTLTNASTFYNSGFIPAQGSTVAINSLSSNTLDVEGAGVSNNTLLKLAAGSLSTATYGINYSVSGSDLTTASGVAVNLDAPYALDGNLTANAAPFSSFQSVYGVVNSATLTGSTIGLDGSLISSGTVNISATTSITDTGLVNVNGFNLANGSWSQNTASLPGFSAGTFSLSGSSTFLRVAGGAGTSGNPYLISDVYGLQGIGSPSGSLLSKFYTQNQNIDAAGTALWNSNTGFVSIGTSTNLFTGSYNGNGTSITGLTILRSGSSNVGLFGDASGGTLSNIGLIGGLIQGGTNTGSLVGQSGDAISNSYSTAYVAGTTATGGLVGKSSSSITNSYTDGPLFGNSQTGGLVGNSSGSIVDSYSADVISGSTSTGGIIGANSGSTTADYWLQDTGFNIGLFGIGSGTPSGNTNAAPETLANLGLQSTYAVSWNFSLGGVWGINGYNANGQINNGLPYLQVAYPTQALVTPGSQQLVYSGSTGSLNQSNYSVSFNPNNSGSQNVLGNLLSSSPTLTVLGNNINVVNGGAANTVNLVVAPSGSSVVEVSTVPATVTYTPATLSYVANSVSETYGDNRSNFSGTVSGFVGGDTLSSSTTGNLSFSATGGTFANVGSYGIFGSGLTPNSNYVLVQSSANSTALTINQKGITITGTSFSVPFGTTPPFAFTTSGVINGDSLGGNITYSNTDSTTLGGNLRVGGYSYTPNITGYDSNYSATFVPASFSIQSAALENLHAEAYDNAFNYAFQYKHANAHAVASYYAYVARYTAAQQNAHARAYDFAFDYASQIAEQNAHAVAKYDFFTGQ